MTEKLTEALGWYGVAAIILAYALVSFAVISAESITYQLLNLTGAIGVAVDAWFDRNYQPVVLNVIWLLIAAMAIGKLLF